jgi:hypothetical protein
MRIWMAVMVVAMVMAMAGCGKVEGVKAETPATTEPATKLSVHDGEENISWDASSKSKVYHSFDCGLARGGFGKNSVELWRRDGRVLIYDGQTLLGEAKLGEYRPCRYCRPDLEESHQTVDDPSLGIDAGSPPTREYFYAESLRATK